MKQAKPVGTTAHILMGILVFGSIWGCLEATLGSALHLIYFPHTGAIMAGVGCSIMGMALAMYRKPALPMGIGLVAASLKWLDVPLLHMSPFAQVIVNPAMAIVMESLAFSLVATLLMKKMEESIPPRIVAGALAGCLGSVAFVFSAAYLTRFPCWVEAGLAGQLEFIATDGTIWGVVSAILLPFGYGVGRKVQPAMAYARRAKPWFNYAGSAATVLLSISLLLGSISSQSQGRIVAPIF